MRSSAKNILFNERPEYFLKWSKAVDVDSEAKFFIEHNYDHIVDVYNRFFRRKAFKESKEFYYSSPFASGIGYPPNNLISMGIVLYAKRKNIDKELILTERNELLAYFGKVSKVTLARLFFTGMLKSSRLLMVFVVSRIFLRPKRFDTPQIIVHSFHDTPFFQGHEYLTDKLPDLSPVAHSHGYDMSFDVNPHFVDFSSVLRFRKRNCFVSLAGLKFWELVGLYFVALRFHFRNLYLFKSFFFGTESHYSEIVYSLAKAKSIARVISSLPEHSRYIMPWENRGYQLAIECEVGGEALVHYSCGLLSKVSTEYFSYRYLKHEPTASLLAMSRKVKDDLLALFPGRQIDVVKSCRVFDPRPISLKVKAIVGQKILVICPIDREMTKLLVEKFGSGVDYQVRFKFHPYNRPPIAQEKIEERKLVHCLQDYSIAIYAGVTTASIEAYFSGLNVYRYHDLNTLSFDTMDSLDVKRIRSIDEVEPYRSVDVYGKLDYYLGLNELDFVSYLERVMKQQELT